MAERAQQARGVLLALALGVFPFVPSSNLLFPVATVIGPWH